MNVLFTNNYMTAKNLYFGMLHENRTYERTQTEKLKVNIKI